MEHDDLNIMELKTKPRYIVACSLSRNEYNKVYRLKIAKGV